MNLALYWKACCQEGKLQLRPLDRAKKFPAADSGKHYTKAHLRSKTNVVIAHKSRIGVVFDVFALNVMFQVKERLSRSVLHLNNTGLYNIHLGRERR